MEEISTQRKQIGGTCISDSGSGQELVSYWNKTFENLIYMNEINLCLYWDSSGLSHPHKKASVGWLLLCKIQSDRGPTNVQILYQDSPEKLT